MTLDTRQYIVPISHGYQSEWRQCQTEEGNSVYELTTLPNIRLKGHPQEETNRLENVSVGKNIMKWMDTKLNVAELCDKLLERQLVGMEKNLDITQR